MLNSPSSRGVLRLDIWLSRYMPMIAFGGRVVSALTGESQNHVFSAFLDKVLDSRKADLGIVEVFDCLVGQLCGFLLVENDNAICGKALGQSSISAAQLTQHA